MYGGYYGGVGGEEAFYGGYPYPSASTLQPVGGYYSRRYQRRYYHQLGSSGVVLGPSWYAHKNTEMGNIPYKMMEKSIL